MRVFPTVLAALVLCLVGTAAPAADWSAADRATLRSLWIGALPPLPPDPSNAVADKPLAVTFGHQLFFDTRLSSNGKVACATCHQPERAFTDGRSRGVGVGVAARNTMTVIGSAYSPWMFWDGREDSLWSQVQGPLENPVEQGTTRKKIRSLILRDADYRQIYERLFGSVPEGAKAESKVLANVGKALEAYERRLLPGPSRFDRYVAAVLAGREAALDDRLSADEIVGLRLFIGPGNCLRCHNGPLFTNFGFHDTGITDPDGKWSDPGRSRGVEQVLVDPFNCHGEFSDAKWDDCAELNYIKVDDPHFRRGFKTPTLRNVSKTGPYMHGGHFATLADALDHYNRAPKQPVGETEIEPLGFTKTQLRQLEAFLRTLDSPVAAPDKLLRAPE